MKPFYQNTETIKFVVPLRCLFCFSDEKKTLSLLLYKLWILFWKPPGQKTQLMGFENTEMLWNWKVWLDRWEAQLNGSSHQYVHKAVQVQTHAEPQKQLLVLSGSHSQQVTDNSAEREEVQMKVKITELTLYREAIFYPLNHWAGSWKTEKQFIWEVMRFIF